MNARYQTAIILMIAVFALGEGMIMAQQEDVPILRPKKPQAKPAVATLLVMCDLACNWMLDSEMKGVIAEGESKKTQVSLGQHLIDAATQDGQDKVEERIEVKASGQVIMHIELQPIRGARIKAEAAKVSEQGMALYHVGRYAEAKPLFEKACDGGSFAGCTGLGWLYNLDQGVVRDQSQAASLFQKSCFGDYMAACTAMGNWYLAHPFSASDGVPQEAGYARVYFEKACNGGDMQGCNNLGRFYENGLGGVERDASYARTLYKQACDAGYSEACTNLRNLP
jgi:TPR repeat protein